MLEILYGTPVVNGLYVAYIDDEVVKLYAKRIFLMYYNGWFYPSSDQKYRGEVYGFIGPLPSMLLED